MSADRPEPSRAKYDSPSQSHDTAQFAPPPFAGAVEPEAPAVPADTPATTTTADETTAPSHAQTDAPTGTTPTITTDAPSTDTGTNTGTVGAAIPQSAAMATAGIGREGGGVLWFAHVNREQLGPFTLGDLRDRLRSGDLLPKHYIWRLGYGDQWYRIREVPELADVVRSLGAASRGADDAVAERLACTNCFTRVMPAWKECPGCGMALKLDVPSAATVVVGEPMHAVIGLVGAVLALVGLFLPWLHAVVGETVGAAAVSGFDVYLGGTLTTVALVIAFFAVQTVAGGPRRSLLALLAALAGGALLVIFIGDVMEQSTAILAGLQADLVPTDGTVVSAARPLLGTGFFVYAVGILVAGAAFFVPGVYQVLQRPIAGGVAVGMAALVAVGYLQLINGNLYDPLIRVQLEIRGYTVQRLARIETPAAATTPTTVTATVTTTAVTAVRFSPRTVHVYEIHARRRADGRLYVGQVAVALGSLWPLRTLHLQRVPTADEPLFAGSEPPP